MASRQGVVDKIRVKGQPKQFKRGPGLTGQARLQKRLNNLALAASRLARRPGPFANHAAVMANDLAKLAQRLELLDLTFLGH